MLLTNVALGRVDVHVLSSLIPIHIIHIQFLYVCVYMYLNLPPLLATI